MTNKKLLVLILALAGGGSGQLWAPEERPVTTNDEAPTRPTTTEELASLKEDFATMRQLGEESIDQEVEKTAVELKLSETSLKKLKAAAEKAKETVRKKYEKEEKEMEKSLLKIDEQLKGNEYEKEIKLTIKPTIAENLKAITALNKITLPSELKKSTTPEIRAQEKYKGEKSYKNYSTDKEKLFYFRLKPLYKTFLAQIQQLLDSGKISATDVLKRVENFQKTTKSIVDVGMIGNNYNVFGKEWNSKFDTLKKSNQWNKKDTDKNNNDKIQKALTQAEKDFEAMWNGVVKTWQEALNKLCEGIIETPTVTAEEAQTEEKIEAETTAATEPEVEVFEKKTEVIKPGPLPSATPTAKPELKGKSLPATPPLKRSTSQADLKTSDAVKPATLKRAASESDLTKKATVPPPPPPMPGAKTTPPPPPPLPGAPKTKPQPTKPTVTKAEQPRPASNTADLMESIKAGKELKKVTPATTGPKNATPTGMAAAIAANPKMQSLMKQAKEEAEEQADNKKPTTDDDWGN